MNKLAIVGYGKMGKTIEKYANSFGFEVCAIIDPAMQNKITRKSLNNAEIAVEFTAPQSALDNFRALLNHGVNIVTGTTGWHDKLEQVKSMMNNSKQGFFYAPNFSIGMNIMFELNKHLAKIIGNIKGYTPAIYETHHNAKLDKPSGTAVTLAEGIIENQKKYKSWYLLEEQEEKDKIPITAIRQGEVVGNHRVEYESETDTITIEHNAVSRNGFAIGALMACRYMIGKQGIHTMQNMLNIIKHA